MTFFYHLLVEPLLLIYGSIFDWFFYRYFDEGVSILGLSLVINLALLPAYFQMERAGRSARENRAKMDIEIARMKRNFKGRELFFYTRAVHRQFHYRPLSTVFQSADLFLQILVFASVFYFLEHLPALKGAGFIDIPDLSQPDGLFFGINLLPFVMTMANVGSALLYGDDPRKRRQAFILAGVFLVLLYNSPSGMVLYWTSNNVISMLRNLVARFAKDKARLGEGTLWSNWVGQE